MPPVGRRVYGPGQMTTKRDRGEPSPLLAAAEAFDDELERFAHLSESARKGALGSQKALERAAETLKEIADCEEQMQAHARALMTALGAAREQQEAQATLVSQRAEVIRARTTVYGELLQRFQTLGSDAATLNAMGQRLSTKTRDASAGAATGAPATAAEMAKDPELVAGLGELSRGMAEVAGRAQELEVAARAADFEDVARQAESLRQQLLAARNRVVLLHGSLQPN
jgi:hypothetical protein